MGKPIADLSKLLSPSAPGVVQGTVSGVVVDTVAVSSSLGPRRFKVANPGAYKAGDKVRFQGEVLLGKISSESGIPFYSV